MAEFADQASTVDAGRPGFQELMRQSCSDTFDILLVTSWDRLTRSVHEAIQLLLRLHGHSIEVRALDQPEVASEVTEQVAIAAACATPKAS